MHSNSSLTVTISSDLVPRAILLDRERPHPRQVPLDGVRAQLAAVEETLRVGPTAGAVHQAASLLVIASRYADAASLLAWGAVHFAESPEACELELEVLNVLLHAHQPQQARQMLTEFCERRESAGEAEEAAPVKFYRLYRLVHIFSAQTRVQWVGLEQLIEREFRRAPPVGLDPYWTNELRAHKAMILHATGRTQEAQDLFADMWPNHSLVLALIFMGLKDEAFDMIDRLEPSALGKIWDLPNIRSLADQPRWDALVARSGMGDIVSGACPIVIPHYMLGWRAQPGPAAEAA